jgi:hypothetical protein
MLASMSQIQSELAEVIERPQLDCAIDNNSEELWCVVIYEFPDRIVAETDRRILIDARRRNSP